MIRRTGRQSVLSILGVRVSVSCDDPVAEERIHTALRDLAVDGTERVAFRFAVRRDGSASAPEWKILLDGELRETVADGYLEEYLVWELSQVAFASPSDDVRVHGSVVALEGRALIVFGQSGAGKTTLVGQLVMAGWKYLSDEVATIRVSDLSVEPFWRPLAVHATSPLFESLPREWRSLTGYATVVPGSALGRLHGRTRAHALVFLDGTANQAFASARPISRGTALAALAVNTPNLSGRGRQGFRDLASVIDRVPAYWLQSRGSDTVNVLARLLLRSPDALLDG